MAGRGSKRVNAGVDETAMDRDSSNHEEDACTMRMLGKIVLSMSSCAASSVRPWTSSHMRRFRMRRTAVRHSQTQSLELLRLVSSPRDRVIPRDSILCLRSIVDEITPADRGKTILSLEKTLSEPSGHDVLPAFSMQQGVDAHGFFAEPGKFAFNADATPFALGDDAVVVAYDGCISATDTADEVALCRFADLGDEVSAAGAPSAPPAHGVPSAPPSDSEVCTTADSSIEPQEDPEAVKPPIEAVSIPGGVCVESSPGVDATGSVLDDPTTIAAEQRLNVALVENPETVRRVMQLASDFQLSLEAEAAMLMMGRDILASLLDDEVDGEAVFRRRLQGLPDATARSQKTVWLVSMMDDTVSGVLDAGVKLLAEKRLNIIQNSRC